MSYHLVDDEIDIDCHDDDTDEPHQNPKKPAVRTDDGFSTTGFPCKGQDA